MDNGVAIEREGDVGYACERQQAHRSEQLVGQTYDLELAERPDGVHQKIKLEGNDKGAENYELALSQHVAAELNENVSGEYENKGADYDVVFQKIGVFHAELPISLTSNRMKRRASYQKTKLSNIRSLYII